jgi:putative transposase
VAGVSERGGCRILGVARATVQRRGQPSSPRVLREPVWTSQLHALIQQHPTFGYRRLWALLRFHEGIPVNHKAVYRVLKQKRWLVHQRPCRPRPRARGWVSRAHRSNERWAMDVTHIPCGQDGWAHLAAVIDCHDREVIGYEFALRGRAKEAERAIEAACLARFGTLRPPAAPVLRSDNGLIFQSRRFRQACRDYRLLQEFITPYTPEQNGIIERFFRSLKEECVWQHHFQSFTHARQLIRAWLDWYNTGRPHQALDYRSPVQFRTDAVAQAAS